MTKLKPNEAAERTANGDELMLSGALPQARGNHPWREALERIERWFGEFPSTGQFWDREKKDPMSYAAAYGSNGERDFMRMIAREALTHPAPSDLAITQAEIMAIGDTVTTLRKMGEPPVDITGWKLVPDQPTEEMWQAGRSADIHPGDSYSKVWSAMFDAAPNVDDCETVTRSSEEPDWKAAAEKAKAAAEGLQR